MRVTFVQYGDFKEAHERFQAGGPETYYAQRHSVDFVNGLVGPGRSISVICIGVATPYRAMLESGVEVIGVTRERRPDIRGLTELVASTDPTHLILRTPIRQLLTWALKRSVAIFPLLADSFENRGPRGRLENMLLKRLLNDERIPFVANHNVPASVSLAKIGVRPEKILPWDWPHELDPTNVPSRSAPTSRPRLLYVGAVSVAKGVEECIRAMALLRDRKIECSMDILGRGDDLEALKELADKMGLSSLVTFQGLCRMTPCSMR